MDANPGQRGTLWRVASPYFTPQTERWLDVEIPSDVYRFERVQAVGGGRDWHARRTMNSSVTEWYSYYRQAQNAFDQPSDGLIAVFPQLAVVMAGLSRAKRDERPIISWFFNTNLKEQYRQRVGAAVLSRIDRFVVHSTVEIEAYARLLKVPAERFEFVPLQYGGMIEQAAPDIAEPFVFATGSAHRDYKTFFEAVEKLGYRTRVLAGPRILAGLTPPPNVEIIDHMSKQEILSHVRHARVNVIPLTTGGLTAGLVTIVEALRHGRALVATARSGIEDYLTDDHNALLSLPGNTESLASRIEAMWSDDALRNRLDGNALTFANTHCTDRAAAQALVEVLDGVTASSSELAA